eukprot:3499697-Rhodomonas_salina.3
MSLGLGLSCYALTTHCAVLTWAMVRALVVSSAAATARGCYSRLLLCVATVTLSCYYMLLQYAGIGRLVMQGAPSRDQIQNNAFSVRFVPGMREHGFDSALCVWVGAGEALAGAGISIKPGHVPLCAATAATVCCYSAPVDCICRLLTHDGTGGCYCALLLYATVRCCSACCYSWLAASVQDDAANVQGGTANVQDDDA